MILLPPPPTHTNTHRPHGLDQLNVVTNLAVLPLKGVGASLAEGGQGLLAGTNRQGNSLREKRGGGGRGGEFGGGRERGVGE